MINKIVLGCFCLAALLIVMSPAYAQEPPPPSPPCITNVYLMQCDGWVLTCNKGVESGITNGTPYTTGAVLNTIADCWRGEATRFTIQAINGIRPGATGDVPAVVVYWSCTTNCDPGGGLHAATMTLHSNVCSSSFSLLVDTNANCNVVLGCWQHYFCPAPAPITEQCKIEPRFKIEDYPDILITSN